MKTYVLSPIGNKLFTSSQLQTLDSLGEVFIETRKVAFNKVPGLFEKGDKVIAIDPDFSDWSFPNEVIDKIPDLKSICLQSTAFDWLDLGYCTSKGIAVSNVPGYSSQSVAEWAIWMAMSLARKLPLIIKSGWQEDYDTLKGIELKGKTAGVIGLGRIGTKMAELASGLGMKVQYWSRNSQNDAYSKVDLATLFSTSDVILTALVQNEETKKLITDDMLMSMKPTTIVSSINAVHELYNHQLVLDMVKQGKIFGYGFEGHPEKFNGFDGNVLATPSLAWYYRISSKKHRYLG